MMDARALELTVLGCQLSAIRCVKAVADAERWALRAESYEEL
jgi:hypothetical protein